MHLKKLQLLGFKSFADETTLEFGPGITAVVGPNGSGKSNIVDAMLWALGERSAKALRGHASTDVIFNGASSRKPTGLAEVSLFFDNEAGTLPINFKEVQVTRRLFRDGNGEYGLCGSKCRLRDVLDLFLDTGVGPDAGCIISQGEIDAILSAKPEDRRGLIEGAAGIQKYHSRRTETRRRLEKVVTDLVRVYDITSELETQLEPLAAQAEVAREYDALVARLKFLQLAVLTRDYGARRTRIEGLRTGQTEGVERVRQGRIGIESLDRNESLTTRQLRELETQVEALSGELTDLVSRLKSTEGQIAVARERRRALTEQQEYGAREIGQLRARLTGFGEQLQSERDALEAAQHASSGLNQSAAEAEAKLGGANARLSEAARELQLLQAKVIETMRQGQTQREKLAGGRAEAGALEARRGELERLLQSGADEAQTLAQLKIEAEKLLADLKAQHADTSALADARQALDTTRANTQTIAKRAGELREARARLQSRAGALRELAESLEGFQGGTRAVLSAAQRGQLSGNYVPVADAIRAPQELEQAIEVALGGAVNNLICDHSDDARRAVEWLKTNRAGRATFLPLASLRASSLPDRTLDVLRDPAVRGLASELVECRREHERAVDYLLARVFVVETLEDAVRLAKRCDGARLVTLEGELVLPAGAITGGQGKQKSNGLLARKRELDESEEKLAALDGQIENVQNDAKIAAQATQEAEERVRVAQEAGQEVRNQIARQEREVEAVARDLNRNVTQRGAVETQLRNVTSSLAAKAHGSEAAEQLAAEAEIEAKTLESSVEGARAIVAQRQAEKDAIAAEVAEVRGLFGAQQERLSAMRRGVADLERASADAQAQIRQRQIQIERAAGEDQSLVSGEGEMVALLAQLQTRHTDLEANLGHTRAGRAAALEQVGQFGVQLKAAREGLHGAEDELHRIEVRLAATEAEMADMERRFRDEFEMDMDAVVAALEVGAEVGEGGENFNRRAATEEIESITGKIGGLGSVNLGAVAQYDATKARLDFLTEQRIDLETSKNELDAIIAEIDGRIREQFNTTFKAIQEAFAWTFDRAFGGGKTHLALTDPDNLLETGIELRVQMPGKAAQDISLLSGGERALTALAFMLAILKVRPAPFVILDEVDAPLDQSNVGRFTDLLRDFATTTQFIVITHNNGTMQAADVLYGVTQQTAGISTLMSVRLAEEDELQANRRPRAALAA